MIAGAVYGPAVKLGKQPMQLPEFRRRKHGQPFGNKALLYRNQSV